VLEGELPMADDVLVIDGDAHINEPLEVFEEFLEASHRDRRPKAITDTKGLNRILLDGKLYPEPRLTQNHTKKVQGSQLGGQQRGARDPIARLDDMDTDGIDIQVMYGSLGLATSTITDIDFASAMSRACNDYYASFCAPNPDRLKCMATLAIQDIPSAADEARRAVTELGHVGLTLPPNYRGMNLDDEYFFPIYEVAQELDVPVSIHWGNGSHLTAAGTERFDTHFMVHAIGHPFEQMIALASIVCGGVVEAFPNLRFGFLEAGCGWAAYWVERLDEHFERRSREMPKMTREPSEYFADGNLFLSSEPDERLIPVVMEQLGAGCVFYASDYPHTDSKFPYSVKCVRERDDLPDGALPGLLGANAARYYGFDPAATVR
jgi:predicted TIM-barrel fold metal-dependent hydrolase